MSLDIAARRKELGLTLEELGKAVGVSKSTVKKWESGYIKNMRRDKIVLLAKALNVSPLDILFTAEQLSSEVICSLPLTEELRLCYNDFVFNLFQIEPPMQSGILCLDDRLYLFRT